jgi:glycerophosphoryl diester phosphodiesterase
MEEGADGVELDVRLDRDGNVVVIHDPSLERVTSSGDARAVAALSSSELARVDLGGGERVPRLADVLDWAKRKGARVNVELKRDVPSRLALVAAVVRLLAMEPQGATFLVLSSFDPRIVAATARLLPWLPSGLLVGPRAGIPARSFPSRLVGATALHPHFSLVTADSIAPFRALGHAINVWTVNEPDEALRLDALGVDTLISDEPGKILASLASPSR